MMQRRDLVPEDHEFLEQVLGYLNFSSGKPDGQMMAALNHLFRAEGESPSDLPVWRAVMGVLRDKLGQLATAAPAFHDAQQATEVLRLSEALIPHYLEFHRDLLLHQTDASLVNSFFLGRVFEIVLCQSAPWDETDRILAAATTQLSDFIGYRPVPALESQKIEPYPHEWVAPVPLFVRGAGVAAGPYEEVVRRALELLEQTDDTIQRSACFDPELLEELAYDPRAYDFDHPANKRPNYHFGQWDPHRIDNRGLYRRFVVQQVTLDALMQRLDAPKIEAEELLVEAASVLAGTILMAAGISGAGPDTHDSTVTLSNLLPRIANYRDEFYEQLFSKIGGPHGERLRQEAKRKRQPFGGARQHLNAELARRRATQLEHVQLSRLFGRMGHLDSAAEQAMAVSITSARMRCEIGCLLFEGATAVADGRLDDAAELPARIMDLLERAIVCGAMIDPWNILGFDAQFSLFNALENSIHDHRADELAALVEDVFAFYSRLWSEAAARDNAAVSVRIEEQFQRTSDWWHRFATHEVDAIASPNAVDAFQSARHVANSLRLWFQGGAESGDVKFWQPHAESFDAPNAYALVIDALLDRDDHVASMALLIHWVSQADRVPLEQGTCSFHRLVERWILALMNTPFDDPKNSPSRLVAKFVDYLEANADTYWEVPRFEIGPVERPTAEVTDAPDDEDELDKIYDAAYEDMVYRDSTDDGVEGSLFDTGTSSHDEITMEVHRITDRLAFVCTVARIWKLAAIGEPFRGTAQADLAVAMRRWTAGAVEYRDQLSRLLDDVRGYTIPFSTGDHESMLEYDRLRWHKETLLERVISTAVEMADAERLLLAAMASQPDDEAVGALIAVRDIDQQRAIEVFAAVICRDPHRLIAVWEDYLLGLCDKPLLYVPLSRTGQPQLIVETRIRQRQIQDLMEWMPRLGLIVETCQLIDRSREMERDNPVGAGAVTEFDELFKIGYKAIVRCMVESAESWNAQGRIPGVAPRRLFKRVGESETQDPGDDDPAMTLVTFLEQITESLLLNWLAHSQTLRLSVLEKVADRGSWNRLVTFVKQYGDQLFTQRFLNLGNIRAILHQGVDQWLSHVEQFGYDEGHLQLIDDLTDVRVRMSVVEMLSVILEAIIENYGEYRDYNSTTTQSDRGGMLFTLLDFLRLRSQYDRICWKLKPVVLAHEILERRGHDDAARLWRRALNERTRDEANRFMQRLRRLQRKYAMQMPTVADRLAERFVRPLAIDRMRALVKPAFDEAQQGGKRPAFEVLEHECQVMLRQPTGVGFDMPPWLAALEEEVERIYRAQSYPDYDSQFNEVIASTPLSIAEIREQLERWLELSGTDRRSRLLDEMDES